jgi:hypothetical protein
MASLWHCAARMRLRAVLILGAAITAPTFLMAGPAQAALTGTGWTAATVPANFDFTDAPFSPVSCVAGTRFCVAVTLDLAVQGINGSIGQGDLVTTDGGAHWKGHAIVPSASMRVLAISCPTTKVCWVAGSGPSAQPEVAKSTNGGKTWKLATPADWANAAFSWWPNSIDCVSATTCWLAGETANSIQNPEVAKTTDGGRTWTTFSNLPAVTPDANGDTYLLNGISCASASSCVAGGGIKGGPGPAAVISTTDGGATWSLSADPALASLQQVFAVSCLPGPTTSSSPVCHAAGVALQAAGPVALTSLDGGATWSLTSPFDSTGWLDSIACADAQHCWAAGAGTTVALAGTTDGGASWSTVTSDTANEEGQVSCATTTFCVATTDGALWVTNTDGGLTGAAATQPPLASG